jgi:hypothetical protein
MNYNDPNRKQKYIPYWFIFYRQYLNFLKHKQFIIFWLFLKQKCFENLRHSVMSGNTKHNYQPIQQQWNCNFQTYTGWKSDRKYFLCFYYFCCLLCQFDYKDSNNIFAINLPGFRKNITINKATDHRKTYNVQSISYLNKILKCKDLSYTFMIHTTSANIHPTYI